MTDLTKPPLQGAALKAYVSKRDREFQQGIAMANTVWLMVAEIAYELHEQRAWELLGYDTLNAWLAEPERGLQRRQFFRLVELWREYVVVRGVGADTLEGIEVSKAMEVLPAIKAGKVSIEEALEDARSMGFRDLRETYSPNGDSHDPDPTPFCECKACGNTHRRAT